MRCPSIVVVNWGVLVDAGLLGPPVEAGAPMVHQFPHVALRHAVAPLDAGQLVGPADRGQALRQIVQILLGDLDPERLDVAVVSAHDEGFPQQLDDAAHALVDIIRTASRAMARDRSRDSTRGALVAGDCERSTGVRTPSR